MFSMRTLLLIVLIGITSVLAAPTLSIRDGAASTQSAGDGEPLVQSQKLLTTAWFGVPHPSNLPGLPPNAKPAFPDDWIIFGHIDNKFIWNHGHSRGSYSTLPTLLHPESVKAYDSNGASWENWRVDLIVPRYASMLVGYWCDSKVPKPDSKFIRIIFVNSKFLARELSEEEKKWVLEQLSSRA